MMLEVGPAVQANQEREQKKAADLRQFQKNGCGDPRSVAIAAGLLTPRWTSSPTRAPLISRPALPRAHLGTRASITLAQHIR